MDHLHNDVPRTHRELSRPAGALAHVGRVHKARVPLERDKLRICHSHILHSICHRNALCRTGGGLARDEGGIHVVHRHMVGWSMSARFVRCSHRTVRGAGGQDAAHSSHGRHGGGYCHSEHVFLSCGALRACHRRGRLFPGGCEGHGGVFPQARQGVRHVHIQRRSVHRRAHSTAHHPAACEALGMGDGVCHHRCDGFRVDGILGVHVQTAT